MKSKQELRKFYKNKMAEAASHEDPAMLSRLNSNLAQFLKNKRGNWAAFKPLVGEPDVHHAIEQSRSCQWVFPRVSGETIKFCRPTHANGFVKGFFGVQEPDESSSEVPLEDIAGVLVPGLAFDTEGARLGRGKAFYDKTLMNYRGERVGIAFSFQVEEDGLPLEPWDIKMSALVTENQVYEIERQLQEY
ncbi:MAG: 5-formyltetrahydrofolate cyclo-ligase [Bdellovibrionales bacterium]|nr:5-formyltetrahydrofolate cyclo-ligase [Bdellovibrionales bacterium]